MRRKDRVARAKRLAMGSIACTFTSFVLLFVMAYFHDVGQHAPQALAAAVGCTVSFFAAFMLMIAAQEELT